MVLAREISARWTAKSNIRPATPATTHNRRRSLWSEVNARTSRREFRKPPSMRPSLYEPAPSRLCSRSRPIGTDLRNIRSAQRLSLARIERSRSGEVRNLRRHPRMHRGRLACVVDHMADRPVIAQRHCDHVVKSYLRALIAGNRRLDCPGQHYIRMPEDAVHTQPPRLMTRYSIRHLVRSPAVHSRRTRIARLVRRIVRNLGLIKIHPPAIALPQNLELLVMLHKQAKDRDLVSIHDQAVLAGIQLPANSSAVVRSPDPSVVHQCVVAVDPQIHFGSARPRAAHAKENIVQCDRVLHMARLASLGPDL